MILSRRNPVVRFFSSVKVGLVWMGLILFYASIASALPQVRGALEMTEMEIFRHWIFTLLISLFTISLVTATIVRIPFRFVNAGVLTVHLGLLMLVVGSLWYFGTKVEGDVLLQSPRVEVVNTGSGGERVLAEFLASAGESWSTNMPAMGGQMKVEVTGIGRDAGGVVNSARVQVRFGVGEPISRELTASGGAVPIFGDRLALRLTSFPAATQFFDNETPALYVRRTSGAGEKVAKLEGLPLFRERLVGSEEELFDNARRPVVSKRSAPQVDLAGLKISTGLIEDWRMPIQVDSAELPFDVTVTGYVPYVSRFEQSAVGGDRLNPAVNLRLSAGKVSREISLFALDAARSMVSVGLPVEFKWVENEEEYAAATASLSAPHELEVVVVDPPVRKTFTIRRGDVIQIEDTTYELTVKDLSPSWPLMTPGFEGAVSPMASVDVTNGAKSYNRTVIQRYPQLSQDIDEQGTRHRDGPYDPNLVLRYRTSAGGWMSIVAGPSVDPVAAVWDSHGKASVVKLAAGQSRPVLFDGMPLDLTLEQFLPNARAALVPVVEPLETRRPNIAARSMSAVRLVFTGRGGNKDWTETQWCMFSQYPNIEERPISVTVPGDPDPWQVVYSRFARDLGVALLPGKLSVKFFPGRNSVESWRSDFGVVQAGAEVMPGAVYTNQTFSTGDWTLFQSGAAKDHWSYTILGVGNREGIWPMLIGCTLITLGCMFAFYIKPILLRRRAGHAGTRHERMGDDRMTTNEESREPRVAARVTADGNGRAMAGSGVALKLGMVVAITLGAATTARAGDQPFDASQNAAEIDAAIDWSQARLIAVQDAGRYKTLDSFARESMTAMYGREHLPGLSPMASLFEWLFNREAYADSPVIRIKDKGVRIHLSTHMPEAARRRVQDTGYMTPRELANEVVESRIRELEPMAPMGTSMRRVRDSQAVAVFLERLVSVVPSPSGSYDSAWYTPGDLVENLPVELRAGLAQMRKGQTTAASVPDVTPDQATAVLGAWAAVWKGWQAGDAGRVQKSLDRLADSLPTLAAAGVYPTLSQREAEASYYAWGKFTWGMWIYLLGALLAVPALVTGWRTPRLASIAFLIIGIVVHAFGISLRWYILGRIPVANMFEAVVGSAWIGVAVGLLAEFRYKTRVFLLAANVTGFLALALGGFVIPGGGTLTSIMGILDDLMLRIHTVLIIASYALIFLASVIAVVYLFGYYHRVDPVKSAHVGFIIAAAGAIIWAAMGQVFQIGPDHSAGMIKKAFAAPAFGMAAAAIVLLLAFVARRLSATGLAWLICLAIAATTLYLGDYAFSRGAALTLLVVGLTWAGMNRLGGILSRSQGGLGLSFGPALAGAGAMPAASMTGPAMSGGPAMSAGSERSSGSTVGASRMSAASMASASAASLRSQRPILAGAAPGDEGRGVKGLPMWLHHADWSHMIILNMVFVLLFVGIILGAVWADYSWGRPWGWDPKEVFALNTLIIYAMLIHTRFVVKNRGLWTAWLSVAGCVMMAFNWCFVNFYIVGLHSYA